MTAYQLSRTGNAPLAFDGELLAEAGDRQFNGRDQTRWFELRLYRTTGGNYVFACAYRTQWQGEANHFHAAQVDPSRIIDAVRGWPWETRVVGFPPAPEYAERQEHLLAHLERMFEQAVTELMESVDELVERID